METTVNIEEQNKSFESFIWEKHESDKLDLCTNHPWHSVCGMETNQEQDKCCQCWIVGMRIWMNCKHLQLCKNATQHLDLKCQLKFELEFCHSFCALHYIDEPWRKNPKNLLPMQHKTEKIKGILNYGSSYPSKKFRQYSM